ncbi:MAG TPA: FAD-binding oxidoreductase [Candidatus Saccharimonadales bacterium]|nr:FAD-binding oxidoreductase [Candidatus Saccharimonadales bacterium]
MTTRHDVRVQAIAQQVKAFYKNKVPFKIYRGATNSTRVVSFEKDKMLDTGQLNHVLAVDTEHLTAQVEPNVPMDVLVRETLRHGLIPPVVMEFPGITVGGGLQGGAGESSSYKWGTFNRILNWYDIILADGSLVRVSPSKHADLFWGGAGAYGSLGVVTRAELRLIPAKKYVEITYVPVRGFAQAISAIEQEIQKKPDFIDGIMFSRSSGVIIVGNLADESAMSEQTFTKAADEWFYIHAQKQVRGGQRTTERIPLTDYLFRYDRGAFWMGRFAFERLKTPFNRFTRWLLDPLLHTRKMYDALQASGVSQECIIQDLALPKRNTVPFLKYIDKTFGMYPLWLCPLLPDDKSPLLSSYLDTDLVINIGVWGRYHGTYQAFVEANKQLEAKVKSFQGKKWLYAHAYYDEATFWNIYGGKQWYEKLRKKYKTESLPTVFNKVRVDKRYKVSAKRGIMFALLGLSGIRRN